MSVDVRRVRADEWERVRDLRLDAVRDPAAAIAFLHSFAEESAHDDAFWQERTTGAASGEAVAQFVAESDGEWVGTATVLRRPAGSVDHHGRPVTAARGDVVGVFIRQEHRGRGIVEALFDAAARWAASLGDSALTLDVHVDNARAQAAYRRAGFADTGVQFTASIGDEIEMAREITDGDRVQS